MSLALTAPDYVVLVVEELDRAVVVAEHLHPPHTHSKS